MAGSAPSRRPAQGSRRRATPRRSPAPRRPVGHYRLRRRVQFHETDQAGIVHFSWFYRYMEEAEHALWRTAGLSIAAPDSDIGWPRVHTAFDFRSALRFEEEFEVVITIVAMTNKTIRYSCHLMRADTEVATGAMTIACVRKRPDGSMQAVAIPPDIRARFRVAAVSADLPS